MDLNTGDFKLLMNTISKQSGIDLGGYRESYLQRRIDLRMKIVNVSDYSEYKRIIEEDPEEFQELLTHLTVNVTEFMRDKTPFVYFQKNLLPNVMERKAHANSKLVRFWSAGCSYGEEPHSISICAKEFFPEDWNVSIYATDIDDNCLKSASEGVYGEKQLQNVDEKLVEKYFDPFEGNFRKKKLQNLTIRFRKHDLTGDSPVSRHFDVVFCRNVMIYFTEEQKIKMFTNFHESLSNGGYLIIGKSETMPPEVRDLFTPVSLRDKVYAKA
ncbi:chemotaxis protein methyltransferase CheR [Methanohalophilus levihalophilus]|uniref:CheR family methyltransferase n=1 Tax=Methanohalophilus levihalophilus TaxID=1431282 RepID=UPI001AE54FBA|nr:protein-glutamate O-methyltransferase CheR [Methanohalophilus levihalophilus]MBP2029988.1 chemotaxis protein methyltransferase CheR [Methanohalophilus levihalophilus]